jgi:hypothetical protein
MGRIAARSTALPSPKFGNVVLSQTQRRRRSSIDLEEQLEAACAQASATLEAARHASAQARSVRSGVAAVLLRVGESLKRRPAPPASGT